METNLLILLILLVLIMTVIGFVIGRKTAPKNPHEEIRSLLEKEVETLKQTVREAKNDLDESKEKVSALNTDLQVSLNKQENLRAQIEDLRKEKENVLLESGQRLQEVKDKESKDKEEIRESYEKRIQEIKDKESKERQEDRQQYEKDVQELKESFEKQLFNLKESYQSQMEQVQKHSQEQLDTLREMNQKQVDDQLNLIKEQMRTTSETILKARQEELGQRNDEQVSKIIDPLQQSLKEMRDALERNKTQQSEALTRLDETIKNNMQQSEQLGKTADRLTRALTAEVKVQGNFGELKLKQLLEDLGLKEGEQYDTQSTLKDKYGKGLKDDEGKGLIPDFILHFPGNRHVVVDAKMSFTAYEDYVNAGDDQQERSIYLKAHIESVRAQVKRLSHKDYTRYLPSGYNRLNFAFMYVPLEGALNLALMNDTRLWKEAYDQGVLILGPQTMYMNLRVLEMMWTQVRQLENQQAMMDAAGAVIDRVQDFGTRFLEVEKNMKDTMSKMQDLKVTTSDSGRSIITAARNLLKAGAQENRKKKAISQLEESLLIPSDGEAPQNP